MKCPFRVGIQFEYAYVGPNTTEGKHKPDNYVEARRYSVYEECYRDEYPYYNNWNRGCDRIGD